MALARGKPVIATEAGSWFKSYRSKEGWDVIKQIIMACKELDYEAVCIVCLDSQEGWYPELGFRIWTKNFGKIKLISDYWDDFIQLIGQEGQKYEGGGIEMDDLELVEFGSHNEETVAVQQILDDEGYDLSPYGIDGKYGAVTEKAVKKWQEDNGLAVDGEVGPETWQWMVANLETASLRFTQLIIRKGFKWIS